jgi:hypothetical protein
MTAIAAENKDDLAIGSITPNEYSLEFLYAFGDQD